MKWEALRKANLVVFPCTDRKIPAVEGSWKSYSGDVPTPIFGVAIPKGIIVIDMDYYKGVTQEKVERVLGCPLNWQDAELQRTQQGGAHYAFRAPDGLRQGSDLFDITGFDTRAGGRGYICSGQSYNSLGTGLMRLSIPGTLPELPYAAQEALLPHTRQDTPAQKRVLPQTLSIPIDEARGYLKHINPACSRDVWMRVGMAMKSLHLPFDLFNEWSSGALHGAMPENYDPLTIEYQYRTFKIEGKVGPSTLRYYARKGGWKEDWTQVFASRDPQAMKQIAHDICGVGSDPGEIVKVINDIKRAELSALDRELILNALRQELREQGMWSKALGHEINEALAAPSSKKARLRVVDGASIPAQHTGAHPLPEFCSFRDVPERTLREPGENHGMNALSLLTELWEMRMRKDDQGHMRWWNGRYWERVLESDLQRKVSVALMPDFARANNVKGTMYLLNVLAVNMDPTKGASLRCKNGIIDLNSKHLTRKAEKGITDVRALALLSHERTSYNKSCGPVNYNPNAECPEWHKFIDSVFGGLHDGEDRIKLLQEILGVMICEDDLNLQTAFALSGASRGGKGVIVHVLQSLIGEGNYGTVEFYNLGSGKTQSKFVDHRVVIDAEAKPPASRSRTEAAGFFNKMTAGDVISIEQLYKQDTLQYRANNLLLIACNDVPNLADRSGATVNRFTVLDFERTFKNKEDRYLVKRLTRDQELEGILIWAIEGLLRLHRNGNRFTMPESSLDELADNFEQNQPLAPFAEDCLVFAKGARTHSQTIYDVYREWCLKTGSFVQESLIFKRDLKHLLRLRGVRHRRNLRIDDINRAGFIGVKVAKHLRPDSPSYFDPANAFET